MRTTVQPVPPIGRGYPYSFRLACPAESDVVPFPAGCTLLADVALYAGAPAVASLSSEGGSIERIDDTTVLLRLSGADTDLLTNTTVVLDLVRTDPSPDEWLGIKVQLPVERPVTAARVGS